MGEANRRLDPSKFRYVLVRKVIDYGWSKEGIYVAVAKLDPRMIGVGVSEKEAIRNLCRMVGKYYADDVQQAPPNIGPLAELDPEDERDEYEGFNK